MPNAVSQNKVVTEKNNHATRNIKKKVVSFNIPNGKRVISEQMQKLKVKPLKVMKTMNRVHMVFSLKEKKIITVKFIFNPKRQEFEGQICTNYNSNIYFATDDISTLLNNFFCSVSNA